MRYFSTLKTYKMKRLQLLTVLILFTLPIFAQNEYHWRPAGQNHSWNFNDENNWTTQANGAGTVHTTPPTSNDDVFFDNNIIQPITITFSGDEGAMRSLLCTAQAMVTLQAPDGTLKIAGNVQLNGNLQIIGDNSQIDFVDAYNPALILPISTIDLGTNSPVAFGVSLNFIKATGAVELINHDFNTYTTIDSEIGAIKKIRNSFKSNGNNITVPYIIMGQNSENIPRTIDLQNTTLNLTLPSAYSSFNFRNTTFRTDQCKVICYNQRFQIEGKSDTFILDEITFNNNTQTNVSPFKEIGSDPANISLRVNTINVNTPYLMFGYYQEIGSNNAQFHSLEATDMLNINEQTEIYFNNYATNNPVTLDINNISVNYSAGCNARSVIKSLPENTLNLGININTASNINYQHIKVSGSTLQAEGSCNMGLNSGNFIWTAYTPQNYYWVGGNGNWNDSNHWALSSYSGVTGGCVPTAKDNVFIGDPSFNADNQVIELTNSVACNNITWEGTQRYGKIAISINSLSIIIHGNADFSGIRKKGMEANLLFWGNGNHTITSAPDTTYFCSKIVFNNTGTYTLQNDFIAGSDAGKIDQQKTAIVHNQGTFISDGHKIVVRRIASERVNVGDGTFRTLNLQNSEILLTSQEHYYTSAEGLLLNGEGLTYDFFKFTFHIRPKQSE